ncbi:MAG: tRNA uridine-5-carboxymethylaminomethyl(34) synthesis GTPase MnmE, partial [Clostridia bacterium]|nr:tRNA uridine-5-carboxymethylaminomethyl(34) synthesis GTPase MnmE [Clostridia bacterium]
DTIAALATPPGQGGIAIVRVSGEAARTCFERLFRPAGKQTMESHRLLFGHVYDGRGQMIDECMGVLMLAPRSYTREDVAEFQLHGGEQVASQVLSALYDLGVRPAEPGEFTRRAFLNGRIDLSRAEAVMRLIAAQGEQASRAALRQLTGGVSAFVGDIQGQVTALTAGVAAALDYPEEIDEEEAAGDIAPKARFLAEKLTEACDERAARLLEIGFEAALCGRPNVGKSSLLNCLLCEERAIVTDIPGTTRDVVRGSVTLSGMRVNLSDTAGIREQAETVEAIGVERARQAMQSADLVLLVLDGSCPLTPEDEALLRDTEALPRLIVLNKADCGAAFELPDAIRVSAQTGQGLDMLRGLLADRARVRGDMPLTSARHMRLARQAAEQLRSAAEALESGLALDLAAIDLHAALDTLGGITGERVDEKLLDSVFSQFCVGK